MRKKDKKLVSKVLNRSGTPSMATAMHYERDSIFRFLLTQKEVDYNAIFEEDPDVGFWDVTVFQFAVFMNNLRYVELIVGNLNGEELKDALLAKSRSSIVADLDGAVYTAISLAHVMGLKGIYKYLQSIHKQNGVPYEN